MSVPNSYAKVVVRLAYLKFHAKLVFAGHGRETLFTLLVKTNVVVIESQISLAHVLLCFTHFKTSHTYVNFEFQILVKHCAIPLNSVFVL